jgi:hypothetical protein
MAWKSQSEVASRTAAIRSIELDRNQIERLRDALLDVKDLQDLRKRRSLSKYLPFRLTIAEDFRAQQHIEAIVTACSMQDDGFGALLDALVELALEPLDRFIHELDSAQPSPGITWSDLRELKLNLRQKTLPGDDVADAALRATLRVFQAEWRFGPLTMNKRFLRYIDHLARLLSIECVFDYLARCRSHLGSDTALIFCEWERKIASRVGMTLPEVAPALETSAGPAVLQIKFKPKSTTQPPHFSVKAWLFENVYSDKFLPVGEGYTDEDLTYAESELPTVFRDIILEVLNIPNVAKDLRIEVILPIYLLNSDIDLWRIPFGARERAVAGEHPLVVRSLDRLYSLLYTVPRQKWLQKWRNLPMKFQDVQIMWVKEPNAYKTALFDELERGPALAFIGLTLDPTVILYTDQPGCQDVLEGLISAGTPIAFWLREHRGSVQNTHRKLKKRLLKAPPQEWPQRVFECRRKEFPPAQKSQITCRSVTLFWDNADNLPPDFEWQRPVPTQRTEK